MVLIDSNIWIATKKSNDSMHQKAQKIIEHLLNTKARIKITDYILDEVVTFLERKTSHNVASETLEILLTSKSIEMIKVDGVVFDRATEIFKSYSNLSFTDCTIIAVAENIDDHIIYSFDSGFDKINWITRKDSV